MISFLRTSNLTYMCRLIHSFLFNMVIPRLGSRDYVSDRDFACIRWWWVTRWICLKSSSIIGCSPSRTGSTPMWRRIMFLLVCSSLRSCEMLVLMCLEWHPEQHSLRVWPLWRLELLINFQNMLKIILREKKRRRPRRNYNLWLVRQWVLMINLLISNLDLHLSKHSGEQTQPKPKPNQPRPKLPKKKKRSTLTIIWT